MRGVTPLPARASASRIELPSVMTTWAWWRSRSTGGGGQALGHDRVEAGGVEVGGDGDGASFVGGVDEAVERFGGVLAGGQLADVVNDDEVASADAGDHSGH